MVYRDSPLGQVPVMRLEDGTAIADSRAICSYLDSLVDPYLIPNEPLLRAKHQAIIAFADEISKEILQFLRDRKKEIRDLNRLDSLLFILNC